MTMDTSNAQHAALWLVGPDMPGLLNLGATFVAEHGGNIDKDIADKFGENAVVFFSITAKPADIKKMDADKSTLKRSTRCAVVFQPMNEPTIPPGYQEDLYAFDTITDDAVGLIAEITALASRFGMCVLGHTGERRIAPGPHRRIEAGQRYIVLLPREFDHATFNHQLTDLVKKYKGRVASPLQVTPGLLWWW